MNERVNEYMNQTHVYKQKFEGLWESRSQISESLVSWIHLVTPQFKKKIPLLKILPNYYKIKTV